MSNAGMGIGKTNPSSLKLRRAGGGGAEVAEEAGREKDEGNNERDETSEN
jgi:hypothetical protein